MLKNCTPEMPILNGHRGIMMKGRCKHRKERKVCLLGIKTVMTVTFPQRCSFNRREKAKSSPDFHICSLPYLSGMTSSIGHIPMLLKPPSTAIHCPVMYEAAGDARNATSPAAHSCQHIQMLQMLCL